MYFIPPVRTRSRHIRTRSRPIRTRSRFIRTRSRLLTLPLCFKIKNVEFFKITKRGRPYWLIQSNILYRNHIYNIHRALLVHIICTHIHSFRTRSHIHYIWLRCHDHEYYTRWTMSDGQTNQLSWDLNVDMIRVEVTLTKLLLFFSLVVFSRSQATRVAEDGLWWESPSRRTIT